MTLSSIPSPTLRPELLECLANDSSYDLVVVGGGATGLGVALDAATRGFRVALVEAFDFAKGTSSRATKLVHGGVRYLAQGNVALVREALHERTTLLHNAPHLAQPLPFVMPSYHCWETPFYGIGLKMYDALAGKAGLGATEFLGRARTLECLPTVRPQGLKGSVKYWDGQFDDARLALALARTAARAGAVVLNYVEATGLIHENGSIAGIVCRDTESGRTLRLRSRCVVNATGVWVDALREHDAQATGRTVSALVAPSQGVHLVVDREFLGSEHALMVPKTADGRVLFAVPWLGKVILGTTDTPRHDLAREPAPFADEVAFILNESARYLRRAPLAADVRSVWVGLRPLVKPQDENGDNTKSLSREHTVTASRSGLVTVTGGKWTTYRAMAEDVLQKCVKTGLLEQRVGGATNHLPLVGAPSTPVVHRMCDAPGWHSYGSEEAFVRQLPGADAELDMGLTEAMVRFAVRNEYARTVEDVLARRWRALFLDARRARAMAARVAEIVEEEGQCDAQRNAFEQLAQQYASLPA
ncbi:MAG: glycerol-3-phosphate dehydrogenase/oxidase [Burkholderiaceae bacterium]|nr:glycerol-3-phosphate dehydrogenase/oxidase [Burkholderiaceae bacterium]